LPKEYQNSNVLVQINGAGKSEAKAHFANQLNVVVSESHGMLQVMHEKDNRPLPKTYVKVFAEVNGRAKFHKDGYTDLRGKFDYISLSGSETKATRYSLLIMSEKVGAKVVEVVAPKQ
jgi:hypothetical protein